MKLPKKLYPRLALITSVMLVMGSALVYAFTPLVLTDADIWKPLASSLMKTIMTNVNELNANLSSVTAKIWTLTTGKWCTSDGTKIDCTASVPVGITGPVGPQWPTWATGPQWPAGVAWPLGQNSCSWIYITTCWHSCWAGVAFSKTCPVWRYVAWFGVHTYGEYSAYNFRIYCCAP